MPPLGLSVDCWPFFTTRAFRFGMLVVPQWKLITTLWKAAEVV